MKIIYAAERNADSTEGRGPMVPIAYFDNESDAKKAAVGHGVMGYGDGEVKAIKVYASIEDWQNGEQEDLRKKALAKLSPAEIKALGLEDPGQILHCKKR